MSQSHAEQDSCPSESTAPLAQGFGPIGNLRRRTISSGAITMVTQFLLFVMNLGSTMVLARLLLPQDFGLIAMVLTVLSFLRIFKDAGLSTATVQRKDISHAQVSNLFWINATLSAVIACVLALAAPLVAWFYDEPRLVGVTLVLSTTFVFAGLNTQHMALLNRYMRFGRISMIQVGAMLGGIITGIVMARARCGHWSIVGMQVSQGAIETILTWCASPWRPQRLRLRSGTRPLIHFGGNLTFSTLAYSLSRGMDALLIGRYWGASALGLYSRAAALLFRPIEQLVTPIHAVLVPALSRLQSHPERYHNTFTQAFEALALVSFFVTGFSMAAARPLTAVVLGANWTQASPMVAIFTFAALYSPLSSASSWLLASQGRGHDWLVVALVNAVVTVLAFVAGLPFGAPGVALAYSVSCLAIQLPVLFQIAGRTGPVSTRDLWRTVLHLLPVWAVTALITELADRVTAGLAPLLQLATLGGIASGLTGAFCLVYRPARAVLLTVARAGQDLLSHRQNSPPARQPADTPAG